MAERESWAGIRERRLAEPGAADAYEAARLAFELGAAVRELRVFAGESGSARVGSWDDTVCCGAFRGRGHDSDTASPGKDRARLDADLTVQVLARTGAA
jgi:hypothetical protein